MSCIGGPIDECVQHNIHTSDDPKFVCFTHHLQLSKLSTLSSSQESIHLYIVPAVRKGTAALRAQHAHLAQQEVKLQTSRRDQSMPISRAASRSFALVCGQTKSVPTPPSPLPHLPPSANNATCCLTGMQFGARCKSHRVCKTLRSNAKLQAVAKRQDATCMGTMGVMSL